MRADVYLTKRGYASSRCRAQELIEKGLVLIDGKKIEKPSVILSEEEHSVVVQADADRRFVSRGGEKLERALQAFDVDPGGMLVLDIGASTGGFTDCLLQHGAAHVIAVDAGIGQLAISLRADPRVTSMEKVNARNLNLEMIGGKRVDLIVMDVSFISATYILPRYADLLVPNGEAICLIKPQFEVGRSFLGKGGIVKDEKLRQAAIERVCNCASQHHLQVRSVIPSPILGGDGNREFLAHMVLCQPNNG